MEITKETTVEEVIRFDDKLMAKMIEYGFDCCCGAYKSIKESAEELGVDPDEVVNALQAQVTAK